MSRSRAVLFTSMIVVVLGVLAGLGALWLDSARAAVGPLPGEGLVLPADTRFVMGVDVKRLVASPFWTRYASEKSMRPEAWRDLETWTGLNPARDIDQIVVAGGTPVGPKTRALVLALGRFDLQKLGWSLETAAKAAARSYEGTTLYTWSEKKEPSGKEESSTLALLSAHAILLGPSASVEETVAHHARGATPLRQNAPLLGLVEKVRPGSTFWMVGDQSLLTGLPSAIAAPGGAGSEGAAASLNLPPLKALTVTGDLDPEVSLSVTGEAVDDASAAQLADVVRGFVALMSLQARQKPELQQLAAAISVATEKNRVLLNARLPYELVDALRPKPEKKPAEEPAEKTAEKTKEKPAEADDRPH